MRARGLEPPRTFVHRVLNPVFAIPARTADALDSHAEVRGGGGADEGEPTTTADGAPKDLAPHIKKEYQRLFDLGQYSGWNDPKVKKELTYLR